MKSNLGGMQLHYNRTGAHEKFKCTFDAPKTGKYSLTARVVTPSWKQHLMLTMVGYVGISNLTVNGFHDSGDQ